MAQRIRLALTVTLAGAALAIPAQAADNAMQQCGAKYQTAKSAKALPAGQTWPQFLAQCRGAMHPVASPAVSARPVVAPPTAAAGGPGTTATPGLSGRMMGKTAAPAPVARTRPVRSGQPSAAMTAMHQRQQQCGQQWKTAKAAGGIPANQTWPQYWSQCNARLKS